MAIATKTLTKSVPNNGYNSDYYTYQCVVTENSYNATDNSSNVTITFSIKGPWAPSFYEWDTNYGIAVDGVVKKTGSSEPYVSTSYVQLLSWTGNITHNSDGAKSISVGVYLNQSGADNYLPKQYTSSSPLNMGSVTLTKIPRASTITSAANVTLGNKCSIKWTPASTSLEYKLKFVLGSWSYTTSGTFSLGSTDEYDYNEYTIPASTTLLNQIPNSTTGTMTVTLYTYNSGATKLLGSSSKTFTVTVPNNIKPTVGTITLTPTSINGQDILVQGKNRLTVGISGCNAGTGSSIKSYTFSGPGISTTTTSTSVTSSGTISNTGTLTYTVTVTDNRGRTNSTTATIDCYEWSAPSIVLNAYRVQSNTSTEENNSGTCMRCSYELEYSGVNDTNDVDVKIYYKKSSENTWSDVTALISSKDTSGDYVLESVPLDSTYIIYAEITDNYGGNSTSNKVTIFSAERVFNIRQNGSGMALGKMAEKDNKFDCKWPAHFDTTVCIGNKDHYNDGNTGVYLNPEGYIHLQRDPSFVYGPYIRFNIGDVTNTSSGDIRVNPSNKYMTFSSSERYLFEAGKLYSGNCQLATNKVLWTNGTGAYYALASHTFNLDEPISEQANGIVIIFSKYDTSVSPAVIKDENFASFFIPKQFVTDFAGKLVILNMSTSIYSSIASKALVINNTSITGHANNSSTGTGNGVTYNNKAYVIRRIIGV